MRNRIIYRLMVWALKAARSLSFAYGDGTVSRAILADAEGDARYAEAKIKVRILDPGWDA